MRSSRRRRDRRTRIELLSPGLVQATPILTSRSSRGSPSHFKRCAGRGRVKPCRFDEARDRRDLASQASSATGQPQAIKQLNSRDIASWKRPSRPSRKRQERLSCLTFVDLR